MNFLINLMGIYSKQQNLQISTIKTAILGLTKVEPFLLTSIYHFGTLIFSLLNIQNPILEFIFTILPMYFGIMNISYLKEISFVVLSFLGIIFGYKQVYKKIFSSEEIFAEKNFTTKNFITKNQLFLENGFSLLMTSIIIFAFAADFKDFNSDKAGLAKPGNVAVMDLATGMMTAAAGFISTKLSKKLHLILALICIVGGVLRYLACDILKYRLIPHEFGEHLNYSFILAIMCLLGTIQIPYEFFIGLSFCFIQEILLFNGLKDKIFAEKTSDFLSKNIEGISSLLPSFGLFLMSRAISLKCIENPTEIFLKASSLFLSIFVGASTFSAKPCRRTNNLAFSMLVMALGMVNLFFFSIWDEFDLLKNFQIKSLIFKNPIFLFVFSNFLITAGNFMGIRSAENPILIHFINIGYLITVFFGSKLILKLLNTFKT